MTYYYCTVEMSGGGLTCAQRHSGRIDRYRAFPSYLAGCQREIWDRWEQDTALGGEDGRGLK